MVKADKVLHKTIWSICESKRSTLGGLRKVPSSFTCKINVPNL